MGTVLAIGAHSDDIEFYAGGTLAKLAGNNEIIFIIATDGRYGTHGKTDGDQIIKQRKDEQGQAGQLLGIKEIFHLGFEDGELEYQLKELKQSLLRIICKFHPEIIFSFDPENQYTVHEDYHPDHRTIALAVMDVILIDATLPIKGGKNDYKPKIYLYDPKRPTIKIKIEGERKNAMLNKFSSQREVLIKQQSNKTESELFRIY